MIEKVRVNDQGVRYVDAYPIGMRCPYCLRMGIFDPVPGSRDMQVGQYRSVGSRYCPNPACNGHVFVVTYPEHIPPSLVTSYPPERIPFDTSNIPDPIVAAFQEALTCHENHCFVAAGIMIRKTLEELCNDRGATGHDLKVRIKALGATVVLPQALLGGVDDLRLLGNDAAHLVSKTYNQIGQDESEVAIEFTTEVLKAVYQYTNLLAKIQALKKPPPTQTP